MSEKPKYVAHLRIEKIMGGTRSIGFSDKPEEMREDFISIKVSRDDLPAAKLALCRHLDLVEEP